MRNPGLAKFSKPNLMEKDWRVVYTTNKLYQAEMVKDILSENDIEAILLNKQDSLYLIGDIEVYVKPDDVIKAKFIIKDF